jgi:hypothetical protein
MDTPLPAEKAAPAKSAPAFAWWLVLALVGLDYFSTLAYLPTIAVEAVQDRGPELAPLAAAGVVLVTLLGALPVYFYVVGRSPHGEGATGLLERRVRGWRGKVLILVLLGFVATDFVITRTLSVADAAHHVTANTFWKRHVDWAKRHPEEVRAWFPAGVPQGFFDFWNEQLVLTVILTVLGFALYAFILRGFSQAFLWVAAAVVLLFMALNAVVIGSGLYHLARHPDLLSLWFEVVRDEGTGATGAGTGAILVGMALLGLLAFPQMALGLSGFELSMTSAPLVRGRPDDDPALPRGRIRDTRKLLVVAALIMSVYVLASVLVVTLLVPHQAAVAGAARHRALAYLAHGGALAPTPGAGLGPLFGKKFGTLYDLSAVLILCLAGASVTIGLRNLVPQYLSRYGMQLEWARKVGVILHLFNLVILVVTVAFQASVSHQQWAYATSVLVLLLSASLAAGLDLSARWRGSWGRALVLLPFALVFGFFVVMAGLTVFRNVSGLAIALLFVLTVLGTAFASRWLRSTELRFQGFNFADERSKVRWDDICRLDFQVLVPHRPGLTTLADKEKEIRLRHRLGPDVPILFVEAEVGDPSEFYQTPLMRIDHENGLEVIRVFGCNSVAHVLAAMALEFRHVGHPPEVHFGWSEESPLAANLHFLLFGEGNVPWMVHSLIRKAEPNPARRPRVVIG